MKTYEFIKKHWSLIIGICGMLSSAAIWLVDYGSQTANSEQRLFSTPEIKVETELYIKKMPDAADRKFQRKIDSMDAASRRHERELRTKLLQKADSARIVTDSINRLNADQLYQMKNEFKQLKEQLSRLPHDN